MNDMPEHFDFVDIWVLAEHRKQSFTPDTYGLINEAKRLLSLFDKKGRITALIPGAELPPEPEHLGLYGVDRVLCLQSETLSPYHGERYAAILFPLISRYRPKALLTAQSQETVDLCARLGGLLETGVVTRAMDLNLNDKGEWVAVRPVANGYLFEEINLKMEKTSIFVFLPTVLMPAPEARTEPAQIDLIPVEDAPDTLETEVIKVIEADPETLDIEEADILVSAGRGVGTEKGVEMIHDLAGALGGSVAATRPVIDRHLLPYERQIGQTGKTVAPRLIINCGISGANEYTAGMENAGRVVAINSDPRARIFRFADLGIVADVHELLPLLINRIREMKDG
jgi:electron transfer flavoprotein alpha subunit